MAMTNAVAHACTRQAEALGSFIGLFIVPSLAVLVYLYISMPETKGRLIADIIIELQKRSHTTPHRRASERRQYRSIQG